MSKEALSKKTKEELVDLVIESQQELKDAEATITDMQATIEQLNAGKKQAETGIVVIKHQKKEYQLLVPKFNFGGQRGITAAQLEKEPELVNSILALEGQQILTPLK